MADNPHYVKLLEIVEGVIARQGAPKYYDDRLAQQDHEVAVEVLDAIWPEIQGVYCTVDNEFHNITAIFFTKERAEECCQEGDRVEQWSITPG